MLHLLWVVAWLCASVTALVVLLLSYVVNRFRYASNMLALLFAGDVD